MVVGVLDRAFVCFGYRGAVGFWVVVGRLRLSWLALRPCHPPPPLELGGSVAHVTPLPVFCENLLALNAPFLNVVVRWVVEIDAEKTYIFSFDLAAALVATHNSESGCLCTNDARRLIAHEHRWDAPVTGHIKEGGVAC